MPLVVQGISLDRPESVLELKLEPEFEHTSSWGKLERP